MTPLKFLSAAAILAAVIVATSLAQARGYHMRWYGLPYPISYLHNYGPGLVPGTFAFYDGPSTNACFQGAAAYLGQDRRRHPCY